MKRKYLLLLVLLASLAMAQQNALVVQQQFSAVGTSAWFPVAGYTNFTLTWSQVGSTTVTGCSVQVDSSPVASGSGTAGGLITSQSCSTNGTATVTALAASYARINVTAITAGTIKVTYSAVNGALSKGGGGSGSGTVTQVNTGTGLTGGPITVVGTVSLANTAVTPGSYTNTNLTVDQQGRITVAANGTSGGVTLPIYLTSGTPTSQGNECSGVTTDSSGGTVTAVAAQRVIVSSVGHDVLCVVTADAVNPAAIGSLVFPGAIANSPNSAASQMVGAGGEFEILSGAIPSLVLTNNSGTTRTNNLQFRACPTPSTCGTDMTFKEDPAGTGKEEYLFSLLGGNSPLYFGNRINATHPGIYFGSFDASTGAYFGLDNVAGHLDHTVRLASNADMWGTLTLSTGTASYTFDRAFASAPICSATWQGTGNVSGVVKCVTTTTGLTLTSSGLQDTGVFAYELKGNNN